MIEEERRTGRKRTGEEKDGTMAAVVRKKSYLRINYTTLSKWVEILYYLRSGDDY